MSRTPRRRPSLKSFIGTLFLDEVSELAPATQAKLLRVLDTKVSRRLGDVRERGVDVRVVSASNRDLKAEVAAGRFRQDLYFRLSAASVTVPPLRERPRELVLLARAFLDEACLRLGRPPLALSDAASARLAAYAWPGNVRELKNAAHYLAAAIDPGATVDQEHLASILPAEHRRRPPTAVAATPLPGVQEEVRTLEKRRIMEALELCDGNQSQAAKAIGMPRRTFVAKLKQYGLQRPR